MNHRSALASLHVAVALFGFAALFGKWVELPATAIVLGRTIVAAATLAVVCLARREPVGRPTLAVAGNGAILALHWVSFFAAIQVSSVAVGLLGYASFPLFVLLFERRFRARGASALESATALLAALGLIVIVPDFSWGSDTFRGLALGCVSGFTFAWLTVRNRKIVEHMTPTRIALWQNLFAAACLLVAVAGIGAMARPSLPDVALLLVLGVACTGLAHTLFIASMQRLSAHTASVVAALEPVYGIALAALLLHEIPTGRTLAGGVLIVAAALVASRRSA
ncbi:MAG TPA: DMT family transporter [Casimicrobiaceae bacterium]|nr:DMT family transporter [Casimicrobiaceae bacterium]